MKKMLHDQYLDYASDLVRKLRNNYSEIPDHLKNTGNAFSDDIISYALGSRLLEPSTSIVDAHIYMANYYHKEKNVYILERDLSKALLNSNLEVDVSEVKFPHDIFIIYPNFLYEDINFPQNDTLEKIEFFFIRKEESDQFFHFHLCVVTQNKKYGNVPEMEKLENSGMATLILPKDEKYSYKQLHSMVGDRVENAVYIGADDNKNTEDHRKVFFHTRDKLFNLFFGLFIYLDLTKDQKVVSDQLDAKHIAAIKNPKKRRKAEKQFAEQADYAVRYIGKNYTSKIQEMMGTSGDTKNYKYQIEVPGFINYYWYGSRKDAFGNKRKGEYKKAVWIEPQIRLPHLPKDDRTKVFKVK